MRYFFELLVLVFSFHSFADYKITTQIHDIDVAMNSDNDLVLLMSGDVIKIPFGDINMRNTLQHAQKDKSWMEFTINPVREILSIQNVPAPERDNRDINSPEVLVYEPTILSTYEQAQTVFNDLNPHYRNQSQCYNRAHVWAYESLKKHGVNSMKVFLFFTRKYIRAYNYFWWFHVTPFTYVSENGSPVEKTLDYRFSNKPLNMQNWTNIFMYNDAVCPAITKYSDYSQHEYDNWCYTYRESMYYYQPLDLEKLENSGQEKTGWVNWEVRDAYSQGFRK